MVLLEMFVAESPHGTLPVCWAAGLRNHDDPVRGRKAMFLAFDGKRPNIKLVQIPQS